MEAIVVRTVGFAAFAALLFVPLERLFGRRSGARSGLVTDLLFATVGETIARIGLVSIATPLLASADAFAPERPWIPDSPLGQVAEVVVGLGVIGISGYVFHRLSHTIPFLWRIHAVHHTSESMDWLAAFRRHPLDVLLTTIVQNGPVVLLGVPLGAHVAVIVALRIQTVFVHSDLPVRLGPLRYLVATPDFHHRHHARAGDARNFSTILPLLDHLFGTADESVATEFGVDEPHRRGFLGLLAHPFRRADPVASDTAR